MSGIGCQVKKALRFNLKTNLTILILIIVAIGISYALGYSTSQVSHDADLALIKGNLIIECSAGQIGAIDCQTWAEGMMQ
jgi:hypothetical protein